MKDIEYYFKNTKNSIDKFEHYLPLYEKWFSKFVGKSPKILEVGVQFGGSADLWRNYFGAGTTIIGVDINVQATQTEYLTIVQGDQGSETFWEKTFIEKNIGDFDIIIDDGSHDNPHQIVTLQKTFNLLKDGGVYWCEDTHTSYYHNVRVRDGGYKNEKSFVEYVKNIIDVIHREHTKHAIGVGNFVGPRIPSELIDLFRNTYGIHFYDSIVIVEKDQPIKFKRITR